MLLEGDRVDQDELMGRMMDEAAEVSGRSSINGKYQSLVQLQFVLTEELDKLDSERKQVLKAMADISKYPDESLILQTAECCLRPCPGSDAPMCEFCCVDGLLKEYEKLLFSKGVNTSEGTGFRSETEVDRILAVLFSHTRKYGIPADIREEAKEHIRYTKLVKKEYERLRTLFSG